MIGHKIVRTIDKGRGIDAPVPPTIHSGQPARDMRRIASFFCLVRTILCPIMHALTSSCLAPLLLSSYFVRPLFACRSRAGHVSATAPGMSMC